MERNRISGSASSLGGWARALEAKKNAHDSQPEIILTDGHRSYNEGISYAWFNGQKPKHIAKAGIRKPNATNNRIERLNGTLRERVKVQRGWKTMQTPLAEGARIHYNFVKPHDGRIDQIRVEYSSIESVNLTPHHLRIAFWTGKTHRWNKRGWHMFGLTKEQSNQLRTELLSIPTLSGKVKDRY